MKAVVRCAVAALSLSCSSAFAENLVAVCMTESDPAARLRCYDLLATMAKPAPAAPQGAPAQSAWRVNEEKSPVDDRTEIFAHLSSRDGEISMVLRCKDNRTDAFLNPSKYIGIAHKPTVTTRINADKATTGAWPISLDGEAAFSPAPIPFMKSLPNDGTLFVRIESYNGRRSEGAFDLGDVSSVRSRVAELCAWK